MPNFPLRTLRHRVNQITQACSLFNIEGAFYPLDLLRAIGLLLYQEGVKTKCTIGMLRLLRDKKPGSLDDFTLLGRRDGGYGAVETERLAKLDLDKANAVLFAHD